ncbi:hypothetical protein BFW38_14240 [Terasakiispira papahanaumokuakeensis]|uniref:Uncharacterized protein n=1 Tax=Terasakiispira papahanaumokuakeensis TaxID=197479 RepID=A0A1E2VBY7_9GAMM|nr:hypothetical protein [Terasakiispira papahanaumokuakeensis]ODC04517.1 hypothetical protein BFW38_14240 [Terasakiispira papahanaumokuakeensis]
MIALWGGLLLNLTWGLWLIDRLFEALGMGMPAMSLTAVKIGLVVACGVSALGALLLMGVRKRLGMWLTLIGLLPFMPMGMIAGWGANRLYQRPSWARISARRAFLEQQSL